MPPSRRFYFAIDYCHDDYAAVFSDTALMPLICHDYCRLRRCLMFTRFTLMPALRQMLMPRRR